MHVFLAKVAFGFQAKPVYLIDLAYANIHCHHLSSNLTYHMLLNCRVALLTLLDDLLHLIIGVVEQGSVGH